MRTKLVLLALAVVLGGCVTAPRKNGIVEHRRTFIGDERKEEIYIWMDGAWWQIHESYHPREIQP